MMDIVCTQSARNFGIKLEKFLHTSLFQADVRLFKCGEMQVSVPKIFKNVIVIASTLINNDWIELFLLLDALRSAQSITLCLTYVGYARQDQDIRGISRGIRLFLDMLKKSGVTQCICVDLHNCDDLDDVIHCSTAKLFALDIIKRFSKDNIIIVSPDAGGEKRARSVADLIGVKHIIGQKQRLNTNVHIKFTSNVKDKICILVDDIIDSGATLYNASEELLALGSKCVIVYATHRVLSEGSINLLSNSHILEINLTDSIDIKQTLPIKFREMSIVPLIASAIKYIM